MNSDTLRENLILQGAVLLLLIALCFPLIVTNMHDLTDPMLDVFSGRDHGGDYIAFYAAGQLYAKHHDATAYDFDQLREVELTVNPSLATRADWMSNRVNAPENPPFILPFLAALAQFPLPVGFAITTALEAALLGALLAVTARLTAVRALPLVALAWVVSSLAFHQVWQGLRYAQFPAYLIGLAFAAGIVLLRDRRPFWAGLAFALIWLKFQYLIPLVVFLIVLKEWRALAGLALGSLPLVLLSFAAVGLNGMWRYLQLSAQQESAPPGFGFINYDQMYNWRGQLQRLFGDGGTDVIVVAELALILVTLALALWAWMAPTAGIAWRRDARFMLLSVTLILASPHTHGQDLVLLLPGLALVMSYLWSETSAWQITLVSGLVLLLIFWLLGQYSLLGPAIHLGVVILAILFAGFVVALRTDVVAAFKRWLEAWMPEYSRALATLSAEQLPRV